MVIEVVSWVHTYRLCCDGGSKAGVQANDDDANFKPDVKSTWAVIPTDGVTLMSSKILILVTPPTFAGVVGFEPPTPPTRPSSRCDAKFPLYSWTRARTLRFALAMDLPHNVQSFFLSADR